VLPSVAYAASPVPTFSLSCNGPSIASWQNVGVTSVTFAWTQDGVPLGQDTVDGLHGHGGFTSATTPTYATNVTATFYLQHGNNPAEQLAALESSCPGSTP
jgi:hypothetical protein